MPGKQVKPRGEGFKVSNGTKPIYINPKGVASLQSIIYMKGIYNVFTQDIYTRDIYFLHSWFPFRGPGLVAALSFIYSREIT
jgi:hypothetical protein